MFTSKTQIRVPYAETDQMGVVYHSNYFPYFEKKLLATARIILYFMEAKTMKRTTMPEPLLKQLQPYFN